MILRPHLLSSLALTLAILIFVPIAHAQQCVGLPSGDGLLSVGIEGSDGASGEGVTFAYQTSLAALQLHHRSLDAFTLADEMKTWGVRGSVELPIETLSLCAMGGVVRTAYDTDRHVSTFNDPGTGYILQRHLSGGLFERLRLPIGISLGREFSIGERFDVVPFIQPTAVYQAESVGGGNGISLVRNSWRWAARGGVALAFDWLVVRSFVSHTQSHDEPLARAREDSPRISVQAGVRF